MGERIYERVTRTFAVERAKDDADTSEIIITAETLDRDSEIVMARGGDWSGWWKTGAAVLWSHRSDQLPVAKGLKLWIDGMNRTHALFRWVQGDEFADRVRNIYRQGLLAASIGFLVDASEPLPTGGRRYTAWRGIEFSFTPTPSNIDAVAVTRALGLPVADDRVVLWLRDSMPGDEVVLVLADEPGPVIHFDARDVAAACVDAVKAEVSSLVQVAVKRELSRRRGVVDWDLI